MILPLNVIETLSRPEFPLYTIRLSRTILANRLLLPSYEYDVNKPAHSINKCTLPKSTKRLTMGEQLERTKSIAGLQDLWKELFGKSEDVPAADPERPEEQPCKKMKPEAEPAPAEAESQQDDVSDTMQKFVLRAIGTVVHQNLRGETTNDYLVCVALKGIPQPDNDDVQWDNTKARIAGSNGETNSKGDLISGNGVDFFRLELDFNQIIDISLRLGLAKYYDNSTMTCDAVHMPPRVLVSSANPDATFM